MNSLFDYLSQFFIMGRHTSDITNTLQNISNIESKIQRDDSLYLSRTSDTVKYLEMFKIFEKNPELYDRFFKITKVLPIDSANGRIFLISLKKDPLRDYIMDNELLVKIPLGDSSVDSVDSVCYEYYVGLRLNNLRINHRTNHFALVYGKVFCGFDDRIDPDLNVDLSIIKLCDSASEKKIHLVYEYIRNTSTKSVHTFRQYIQLLRSDKYSREQKLKIEGDLIKLLIILMYTLQVAQNNLEFTHYDLHMSNVLVVQLNRAEKVRIKYNNKEIFIVTDVIPHIIDYGRSYVNPEYVKGDDNGILNFSGQGTFTDIQLNKTFSTFTEYQETLFKKTDWVLTNKDEDLSFIDEQLTQVVFKHVYKKILHYDNDTKSNYYIVNGNRNYDLSDDIVSVNFKKMIVDKVYNKESPKNYTGNYRETRSGINITRYNLGITSYKFNPKYDFYRFTRSVLDFLLERVPDNLHYTDMWWDLDVQMQTEYPFYDPNYFSLPCDYHISEIISDVTPSEILNRWLKIPADIGEYLYTHIEDQDDIRGARVHHIGGARVHHIGGNIKSKRRKTEKTMKNDTKDMSDKNVTGDIKDMSDKNVTGDIKDMSDKDFTGDIEINLDNNLGFVYNKSLDKLHKKREEYIFPKQDVKYGSIPKPKQSKI